MDLTQPLKDLVGKVHGAVGAVLIDNEGEAITHFSPTNQNERIRLIAAYHRVWLSDCIILAHQMRLGNLVQMIQRYESSLVVVKALKEKYALVLIGERGMILGQALFYLETIGKIINEDL